MTPDLVEPILDVFSATAHFAVPDIRIFTFGSYQALNPTPSDIDVLVICKTNEKADIIRRAFTSLNIKFPFHLTILTEVESQETSFIENSNAVELSTVSIAAPSLT